MKKASRDPVAWFSLHGWIEMRSEGDTLVWEERWHPLREEWVLYTSHRGGRPWVGDTVSSVAKEVASYDPTCALCPGNTRIRERNPDYTGAFWFTNDLPCFSDASPGRDWADGLYRTRPAKGTAEVVCYHPDHARTMADLSAGEILDVIALWKNRYETLGARPDVNHVLIFENKGALVGTSNPHPHCQIYASGMIYGITARELDSSRRFFQRTGRLLGMEILKRESNSPRVVCENDEFLACVPFFARYAYEVMIFPKRPCSSLTGLDDRQTRDLAALLGEVCVRYDNLWEMPFPYVMAIHQAPTDGEDHPYFPFHFEFHPPLRQPDTMKYLAGPEIGGGTMTNESNPDEKAAELKSVSGLLYRART